MRFSSFLHCSNGSHRCADFPKMLDASSILELAKTVHRSCGIQTIWSKCHQYLSLRCTSVNEDRLTCPPPQSFCVYTQLSICEFRQRTLCSFDMGSPKLLLAVQCLPKSCMPSSGEHLHSDTQYCNCKSPVMLSTYKKTVLPLLDQRLNVHNTVESLRKLDACSTSSKVWRTNSHDLRCRCQF